MFVLSREVSEQGTRLGSRTAQIALKVNCGARGKSQWEVVPEWVYPVGHTRLVLAPTMPPVRALLDVAPSSLGEWKRIIAARC